MKKILFSLFVLVAFVATQSPLFSQGKMENKSEMMGKKHMEKGGMMSKNKEMMMKAYEYFNASDFEKLCGMMTSDFVDHNPTGILLDKVGGLEERPGQGAAIIEDRPRMC